MITNEEIDEILTGCTIYYNQGGEPRSKFPAGTKGYITASKAIEYHLNRPAPVITITKIELTEENKRKLNEYLARM